MEEHLTLYICRVRCGWQLEKCFFRLVIVIEKFLVWTNKKMIILNQSIIFLDADAAIALMQFHQRRLLS